MELPLVSIIMATYNRAHTIERAVNSVLNQTYSNIELIIVDDGSTDNTLEILSRYHDARLRLFKHDLNKGVTAAKNSGLKQIKGEWFTILDSDDEMLPEAINTMMNIPLFLDNKITAVTCNCLDIESNSFAGKGLYKDGNIDAGIIMTHCTGEFWGITKSSLLQGDLFNEKLRGFESILWDKINARANRYYVHKGLRLFHTGGDDRISKSRPNLKDKVTLYENLIHEKLFFENLKKYRLSEYNNICREGLITMRVYNNKHVASKYHELLNASNKNIVYDFLYKYRFVALQFKHYLSIRYTIGSLVKRLIY